MGFFSHCLAGGSGEKGGKVERWKGGAERMDPSLATVFGVLFDRPSTVLVLVVCGTRVIDFLSKVSLVLLFFLFLGWRLGGS